MRVAARVRARAAHPERRHRAGRRADEPREARAVARRVDADDLVVAERGDRLRDELEHDLRVGQPREQGVVLRVGVGLRRPAQRDVVQALLLARADDAVEVRRPQADVVVEHVDVSAERADLGREQRLDARDVERAGRVRERVDGVQAEAARAVEVDAALHAALAAHALFGRVAAVEALERGHEVEEELARAQRVRRRPAHLGHVELGVERRRAATGRVVRAARRGALRVGAQRAVERRRRVRLVGHAVARDAEVLGRAVARRHARRRGRGRGLPARGERRARARGGAPRSRRRGESAGDQERAGGDAPTRRWRRARRRRRRGRGFAAAVRGACHRERVRESPGPANLRLRAPNAQASLPGTIPSE